MVEIKKYKYNLVCASFTTIGDYACCTVNAAASDKLAIYK